MFQRISVAVNDKKRFSTLNILTTDYKRVKVYCAENKVAIKDFITIVLDFYFKSKQK